MKKPPTVEEYIETFTGSTRERLKTMRSVIRKAAPEAREHISYAMPAYELNGPLVYFAGYATHIGFYALPSGHAKFAKALSVYKQGKGSVQFPHSLPLPVDLVSRLVAFRVKENLQKKPAKPAKKVKTKKPTAKKAAKRPSPQD